MKSLKEAPSVFFENFKIYNHQTTILRADQLDISLKGVHGILGPSGCGKSSLLKVLSGLQDDEIFYDGNMDISGFQNGVVFGMVWQSPVLYPFSVRENLSIPLRKRGINKSKWSDLLNEAILDSGLVDRNPERFLDKYAPELSVGQKQRVCLARTLLQNPDILLLDEPTSALDPASTRKIEQLIRTISETIPVILVTHNIGQARRMTSHVTVFCLEEQGGYVCESGPSQKILYKPDSLTVRNFFASETGDDSLWPFC